MSNKTLNNAIAYSKRKADKENYSYYEMLEDGICEYQLNKQEIEIFIDSLYNYCKLHYLYMNDIKSYDREKCINMLIK